MVRNWESPSEHEDLQTLDVFSGPKRIISANFRPFSSNLLCSDVVSHWSVNVIFAICACIDTPISAAKAAGTRNRLILNRDFVVALVSSEC